MAAKICRRSSSALGEREGRNRAEQSRGERKRGRELELEEEEESWSERKRKRAGAKGEEERERKWGKKEGNNTRAKRREREVKLGKVDPRSGLSKYNCIFRSTSTDRFYSDQRRYLNLQKGAKSWSWGRFLV